MVRGDPGVCPQITHSVGRSCCPHGKWLLPLLEALQTIPTGKIHQKVITFFVQTFPALEWPQSFLEPLGWCAHQTNMVRKETKGMKAGHAQYSLVRKKHASYICSGLGKNKIIEEWFIPNASVWLLHPDQLHGLGNLFIEKLLISPWLNFCFAAVLELHFYVPLLLPSLSFTIIYLQTKDRRRYHICHCIHCYKIK